MLPILPGATNSHPPSPVTSHPRLRQRLPNWLPSSGSPEISGVTFVHHPWLFNILQDQTQELTHTRHVLPHETVSPAALTHAQPPPVVLHYVSEMFQHSLCLWHGIMVFTDCDLLRRFYLPISVDGYGVVSTLKLVIISDAVTFLEKYRVDGFRLSHGVANVFSTQRKCVLCHFTSPPATRRAQLLLSLALSCLLSAVCRPTAAAGSAGRPLMLMAEACLPAGPSHFLPKDVLIPRFCQLFNGGDFYWGAKDTGLSSDMAVSPVLSPLASASGHRFI